MACLNSPGLSVVQCNLQRSRTAQQEFLSYFKSHNVDVALISEPYVGNNLSLSSISGVTIFQFSITDRVKACIFLKETLAVYALGRSDLSSCNFAVVDFKMKYRTFTLVSAYVEPRADPHHVMHTLDNLMNLKSTGFVVIGGDFNGNHPLWGSDSADARGEELSSLCGTHNFYVCNIGDVPTFEVVRAGRLLTSIDDVTLVSDQALISVQDWKVDRGVCPCSDHNAITFTICTPFQAPTSLPPSTRLYHTKFANWTKFHDILVGDSEFGTLLSTDWTDITPAQLDDAIGQLTSCIHRACDGSMKKRSQRSSVSCKWWTSELDDMKKEVIHLHHVLSRLKKNGHNIDAALAEYQTAKTKYVKLIQATSTLSFREFCASQGKDEVWSITNRLLRNHPKPPAASTYTIRTPSGFTATPMDTARAILDHFFVDDDGDLPITDASTSFTSLTGNELPFTSEEVLGHIKSFSPRKAPGHDHLTADICLNFIERYPVFMRDLFNRCLDLGYFPSSWKNASLILLQKPGKSDQSDLSSFRPIGLLPVFGKLLEKLFLSRFTYNCLKRNLWSPHQFGFRPQTSTVQALEKALSVIRQHKANKKQVVAVSLDIRSAFSNARWPDILQGLRRSFCSTNIIKLIESYFTDRLVTLPFCDATASKFMTKGCIQGSVCGPTFWNLIVEELLAVSLPRNVHIQAFADDILLIVAGDTAVAVERACAEALAAVSAWGATHKLTFSLEKTQYIAFTKKVSEIKVVMNNVELNRLKNIKLLGVIIDERLSFFAHIRHAIQKATRVYKALCLYVRPTWGLHPDNVETIYRCVIEPIVTYAAGIWGKTAERPTAKKLLTSFQRLFAIKVIRGFRTISATSACALAYLTPLHLKVKEIYLIERVKMTKKFQPLPDCARLQVRTPPGLQVPPREKVPIEYCKVSSQEEADVAGGAVNIFTDGSKLENGNTGAAFVVYLASEPDSPIIKKIKLSKWCSVFQAELVAIRRAMEWVLDNCVSTSVSIYSDSLSSLSAISHYSDHPLVTDIHHSLQKVVQDKNCRVTFLKVKAHSGIIGNETADEHAKSSASSHKASEYTLFPLSYAKREIRQSIQQEWQAEYQSSATGSVTRQWFPTLKSVEKYRTVTTLTFATTQFFTGHGYHKAYLKRFHIVADEQCPCDGSSRQTQEHLLYDCARYVRARFHFETLCSSYNVKPQDVLRRHQNPSLITAFVLFCNNIVMSLKAFNS